jgi:uncharacterized protein (DUF362 family)
MPLPKADSSLGVGAAAGGAGASAPRASLIDGLGLSFKETMSGCIARGENDPARGAERGRIDQASFRFDVQIHTTDLGRFLSVSEHAAQLTGTVTSAELGGTFPIRDGVFNLFSVDEATGVRQMVYAFRFIAADGQTYYLHGTKQIHTSPGDFHPVTEMTHLLTLVYRGEDAQAPVYGAGILVFDLADSPAMMASMAVEGARTFWQKAAAYAAFASFAWGTLRDECLRSARLFYDTRYENLVLSGSLDDGRASRGFFLVSGVHERGFPWGDTGIFWDVLLAVEDGSGGWERYAVTDLVLEGLALDVEHGTYRYHGPIFALKEGYSTSFSALRRHDASLLPLEAEFTIDFDARPYEAVNASFPLVPKLVRRLSSAMAKSLRDELPGENPLGIFINPHTVTVRSGSLRLTDPASAAPHRRWKVNTTATAGEAERGTFRNLREPKALYGYLCAVRPQSRAARVQIHSRTLRDDKEHWVKDRLEAFLGTVVARAASSEMLMEGGQLKVHPLAPSGDPKDRVPPLEKLGDPVLEVANDQFPTGVFLRRIDRVRDPSGEECLALEEDMSLARLEPIGPNGAARRVTVASIHDDDKFRALDRVLEATAFDSLVEAELAASGKTPDQFLVAIKPNFMFAYSRLDPSTYTDPELVHHLVRRLRARGFVNIKVVEAQSTYGQYFDHRSVRDVASYLGYDGSVGYEVVDMTLDADEQRDLGPQLGLHPVSRVWRSADFRISFAKNKTHAYAYYTLTLKCIYGALPLANKFKEYHCKRGIYQTTIEYLKAFPVHFGLVDGYLSADGPFGIFADPAPNATHTIIGGADLVAVDWVGATKMGINPTISPYMKYAVEEFGKPAITLVGDPCPYRPWLNVPVALALFTSKGVDADWHFGNLMYAASAQMDESYFHYTVRNWYMPLLRRLTLPLRRAFFVRTGENPSATNRFFSWLFYRMGF